MLLSRDQPGRRRAISSSIRQSSSHPVQPGVFQGNAIHQLMEGSRINTPLNFPQPTFGTARVMDPMGQGDRLCTPRYILVSEESGRGWAVVDSIRDCQFGQVLRGVQVTRTSSGRWTYSTMPPVYVGIKELSFSRMVDMQGRSHEDPLREVATLQYLSDAIHPNVLQCIEALKDDDGIYIVMPYCSGGEIFNAVAERDYLGEDEARSIFRQALDGLLFLKQRGVCHRDVSLENMMLDAEGVLKIIDFGLALRVPQGADGEALPLSPQEVCGKRFYMAPEVMSRSGTFDGFAVDIWACGVMLFVMLTGIPPFEFPLPSLDKRCRVIAVEQRLGELLGVWRFQISPQAVNLMQSCLTYDPARRPRLEDLRVHPWLDLES